MWSMVGWLSFKSRRKRQPYGCFCLVSWSSFCAALSYSRTPSTAPQLLHHTSITGLTRLLISRLSAVNEMVLQNPHIG